MAEISEGFNKNLSIIYRIDWNIKYNR
jgi:hypothetical protein